MDEWVRAGVRDAVVAPGSRSTPLVLALAADERIRVHVHLDERAAGFFALGLALASGRPAVVVTTSGTAAVELHPAIVEASQAGVPLLACTADRPPELQHVGAPQTVDQSHLFGGAVRWFAEVGIADSVPRDAWRSIASRAVAEAVAGDGPVHLNVAFRDPLVGTAGELPPGRAGGRPWHDAVPSRPAPVAWPDGWAGRRGVIVAGAGCDAGAVIALARALAWPVFADPRSCCRGTDVSVAAFDGLLRSADVVAALQPEVVVRAGAPPASKVLSQWLAALPLDVEQVLVDARWRDPERRAALRLPAMPSAPTGTEPADASWLAAWRRVEGAAQAAIDATLGAYGGDAPTEPGTLRVLTRDTPGGTTLFVSSSMPIRDIEWFGHPASTHRVLANRGANGIDGVVATALGVAASDPSTPVVAVVGDLAFLYDASALTWAARRDVDLTIVVLDNDGGGIFSFLPQRTEVDHDRFEALFGTPHGVDVEALAAVHGIPNVDRVEEAKGTGVRLVHVRTDREANVAVHGELNAAIAAAAAAAVAFG